MLYPRSLSSPSPSPLARRSLALALACSLALAAGCSGGGGGGGAAAPAAPSAAAGSAAAGSATAGAAAGSAAAGCMPVPWADDQNAGAATYRGTLSVGEAGLPNGTTERIYIVALERPACLPAGGEAPETAEIQVYSPDPAVRAQLEALAGQRVAATGEGFLAHTAHHHRPLVVDVGRVAAQ